MGISLRKTENSGVVTLSGSIGRDQTAMMHDYVDLLLSNQVTTIYFDFSQAQTVSMSAIGALSTIQHRVDELGGRLLLAGLHDDLNPLVDLDHLRRFFIVFDGPLPADRETETGETGPEAGDEEVSGDRPGLTLELDGLDPDQRLSDPEPPLAGDGDDSGQVSAEVD